MLKYNPVIKKGKFKVFSKTEVPFIVSAVDSAEAKFKVAAKLGEKEYWKLYCVCLKETVRQFQ